MQSPVHNESFINPTTVGLHLNDSETFLLEQGRFEPNNFNIAACSVAKNPSKVRNAVQSRLVLRRTKIVLVFAFCFRAMEGVPS